MGLNSPEQVWYSCVQVNERYPNGTLAGWYDGNRHTTLVLAQEEYSANTALFPKNNYQVIKFVMTEQTNVSV